MDKYDFSGVVTAYEVKCDDGRLIEDGAFNHQAGQTVPIVWRHGHDDIRNVLGHMVLSVNDDPPGPLGMRGKATFNDTTEGRRAKQLVHNKDIDGLSIWANELKERTLKGLKRVATGTIREVSLVLAGKNPGARIDDVVKHSDDPLDPDMLVSDGIIVHSAHPIELSSNGEEGSVKKTKKQKEPDKKEEKIKNKLVHGDKTLQDILNALTEEQKQLFEVVVHSAMTGEKITPDGKAEGDGETVKEVYDGLSEEQQTVLHYMVGELGQKEENLSQGDTSMTTFNIFEGKKTGDEAVLQHEKVVNILKAARDGRVNSLREVFMNEDSALAHSITDIDFMFPDAQKVDSGGPMYFTRPIEWVEGVLNGTRPRPFSRIKSQYADLTAATARAKGYVTAALKVEEVIAILQRSTSPQTIYKLQKLDRDDILDITEFDVVVWLKAEMRLMLREELARAVLIGDGRAAGADKILEANIRPIFNDSAVYTVDAIWNDIGNEQDLDLFTAVETLALIDYIAEQRSNYRGAGSPVFYCQPEVLTQFLLVRDANNLRIFKSEAEVAAALRVSAIVEIPPMSGMERTGDVDPVSLPTGTYDIATLGVIVNLKDYVIGMDRGGQTSFFDSFDIDYNKHSYLYETRLSGALVTPSSAIAIELVTAKTA